MKLITESLRAKLINNGTPENRDRNHAPVVKLFDPMGATTYLISEMSHDGDLLYGLCDLGCGFPELGYVMLGELMSFRNRFGLPLERDMYFEAVAPMSDYLNVALAKQRIVSDEHELRNLLVKCNG